MQGCRLSTTTFGVTDDGLYRNGEWITDGAPCAYNPEESVLDALSNSQRIETSGKIVLFRT